MGDKFRICLPVYKIRGIIINAGLERKMANSILDHIFDKMKYQKPVEFIDRDQAEEFLDHLREALRIQLGKDLTEIAEIAIRELGE